MRKKDYELIATVVRQFEPEMKEKLAWIFAGQFFAKGYKFDRQKFLTACGINPSRTFDEFWNSPDMLEARGKIKQVQ